MKIPFNPRCLALILGLSVFVACKKDHQEPNPIDPPPTGGENEKPEDRLFNNIQGKWELALEMPARKKPSNVSGKEQDMGIPRFVEFQRDGNYFVVYQSGYTGFGSYQVKDSATIELGEDVVISHIIVADGKLSFDWKISDEIVIAGNASRQEAITINNARKGLLKNWILAIGEEENNEFAREAAERKADKVKRLYTAYGTVFTQYYKGNTLLFGTARSWRLNEDGDIIEYRYSADEDGVVYHIAEIGDKVLRIEQVIEGGEDEDPEVVTYNYSVE